MLDDRRLQKEHREWVDREYPGQPEEIPLAGMVEEAGELLHAVLKMEQATVWGDDARHGNLQRKLIDAIGDCVIYAVSFCNASGAEFDSSMPPVVGGSALEAAMDLVRSAVGCNIDRFVARIKGIAERFGIDFDRAVEDTWEVVRRRVRRSRRSIVTLCGSTRFKDAFTQANLRETLKGNLVLTCAWSSHTDTSWIPTLEQKKGLDATHLAKIDISDEVLVVDAELPRCCACRRWLYEGCDCDANVSYEPYIGESTAREIAHAERLGLPIRRISQEGKP